MQHKHAPRPLPLFLELVRRTSQRDPELASAALQGLARYEQAARSSSLPGRPIVARTGAAALRDCGGDGPPVVLVPSLINPPDILDLDAEVSLAGAVAGFGRRALLLDWGEASQRSELDVAGHVEVLLVPLLGELGQPPALMGYCLGGTMAIAAANLARVERVATVAAPWRFGRYDQGSRDALAWLWSSAGPAARQLGALPMEVLQGAFWSLDPERTVAKFARYSKFEADYADAARFVTLEDWANEGEPLPYPAAREMIEDLFGRDLPGTGGWSVGGQPMTDLLDCPVLHVTAARDRIAPAATAPSGHILQMDAGHVGMVVGSARKQLHAALADFLSPSCR